MGSFLKCRQFLIARRIFRWMRIVVWFSIFLAVVAIAHLHLNGLPDFLKARLLERLQGDGFEAQFVNARLGWGPDIEIENAFFHSARPLAPRLSAGRTTVNFDLHALRHGRLEVRSFLVENGRMEFPLTRTNNEALSVNDVLLSIELPKTNVLQIKEATGSFHGVQIVLNGTATNYAAMLNWAPLNVRPHTNDTFQLQLLRFARALDHIHFKSAPQLHVNASADGNDPDTFRADLSLSAGPVQTPWGQAETIKLAAAASHLATPTGAPIFRAQLSCARFSSEQGRASKLDFSTVLSRNSASNFEAAVHLIANRPHSDHCEILLGPTNNWFDAARLQADGTLTFAAADFAPLGGAGTVEASLASAHPGSVRRLHLELKASTVAHPPAASREWGPLAAFAGIEADWKISAGGVSTPKLNADNFSCTGQWRGPVITLDNIVGSAYGGGINASFSFDASSRELRTKGKSDLDPHRVAPLLSPPAQLFLAQCEWKKPPRVEMEARVVLPPWANRPPDWRSNLFRSVRLEGHFTAGRASYRKLQGDSAESDFSYIEREWNLPRLHAMTPAGEVYVGYRDNELSHDFHFSVDSRADPSIAESLIPPNAKVWLDELRLTTAPVVHGELWGRWHSHERFKFNASLSLSNFWFRNEKFDSFDGNVDYTNYIVRLSDVRISNGPGKVTVPEAEGNISTKEMSITNAESTFDLDVYRRLLGARSPEFLDAIHFASPPTVTLSGSFVATNPPSTVAHFTVSGDHFRWTNFVVDNVSTLGSWLGREVALTNLHATLYNTGTLAGWGVFDYLPRPRDTTAFRGSFSARELNLKNLVNGWSTNHNKIEGMLDADLIITDGNFKTNTSWRAFGSLRAHNALLWDIPMFGILSPILNAISPGMGESRAHDATATFQLTNAVVSTDDLMIHATGFSLLYRGSVNVNKQINARVEAQHVLGPVMGLFLSPLSKLFEYKITGPITHPMMEPLYIPNFLMKIVRPFHTLKQLLPSSPPAQSPPPPASEKPPSQP